MPNILATITDLLRNRIVEDLPSSASIQNLAARLNDLTQINADAIGEGIDRWPSKFHKPLAQCRSTRSHPGWGDRDNDDV